MKRPPARPELPAITRPEWAGTPPTPEQWLDWLLAQTREGQVAIACLVLDQDRRLSEMGGRA